MDLVEIISNEAFIKAFKKAYKLNRNIEDIKLESGFLVQVRPKKQGRNGYEIKINKPMDGNYFGVDLGEDFKFEHCGLPIGEKGEGFYLDDGFYALISVHFHILDSTTIYSKGDIKEFYRVRQENIKRAKSERLNYFINPVFVIGNKIAYPKQLELGFYIFTEAKSESEFSFYQLFLTLKNPTELPEHTEKIKGLAKHIIKPL
jgi:hypothetical protein